MKLKNKKLWRGLFVAASSILAVALVGGNIAYDKSAAINSAFKLQDYKIVKGEEGEEDTEYFKMQHQGDLKEYTDKVCRDIEAEGIVMLRNDNDVLPLAKGNKISLFGQGSVNLNYGSSGSSSTNTSNLPTLKDALKDFEINQSLWDFYKTGAGSSYKRGMPNLIYKMNEAPWSVYPSELKDTFASFGDAAIYVMSRDSGEGGDISTTGSDGIGGNYLSITPQEKEVLQELTTLKKSGIFKKVILLINSPVTVQLDFMFDESISIDGALWIGNVGSTGAYAVNDILTGAISPSGRLSDTYCKDNFSSPAMASWNLNPNKKFSREYLNASSYPNFNDTQNVYAAYVEGIYVGYRYYETRYADAVMGRGNTAGYKYSDDVAFSFGHGLTYGDFWYDNFKLEDKGDTLEVSVDIMNIGAYPAKEVVQVYMQKPYTTYDQENGVEKSAIELAGFEKSATLDIGDFETVTISISKEQFKSYDANGAKTYIVDEGDYYFSIGSSAHNALDNILDYQGYTVDSYTDTTMVGVYHQDNFDKTTYSHSSENPEVEITNQFDFSDMNKYSGRGDNSVTYASRKDWNGTFPSSAVEFSITPQMETDIKSYKDLVEDGSTMPTYGASNGLSLASLRGKEYDDKMWDLLLDQTTFAEQALLITNGQHNTSLVQSVNKPTTKDENGPNGVSGSLNDAAFPSEGIWASSFNKELIEEVGKCLGEDAFAAGITGLYAPGVNLHRTPFGGRAHEYFSEDPYLMGIASMYEVKGMQSKGVLAYVKHYVGNDQETNRNGVATWLNEQEMREIVLLPFEYSFKPSMGNAHATMTSFNRIGNIWASASSEIMETVLRDEWGFDGFSITDMASSNAKTYMTFKDGIANGTNLYDGAGSTTALDDYKDSPMFCNKMRESTHRILYTVVNYSAVMNGVSSNDRIVPVRVWWDATVLSLRIVSGIVAAASAGLLVFSSLNFGKKKED